MRAGTAGRGIRTETLEKAAYCAACFYLALPAGLFMMGWFSWVAAVPLTLALLWFTFTACRDRLVRPAAGDDTVSLSAVGAMAVLAAAAALLAGFGGFVSILGGQGDAGDLFRLLTEEFWPAVREQVRGFQTRFISFGTGFWLPAAAAGKKLGLGAGNVFLLLWGAAGLCILFALLCRKTGKWSLSTAAAFLLFSGLNIAASTLPGRNAFAPGQALCGCLLTLLILDEEDNRRMILLWGCGVLLCPYAFAGLLPFIICRIGRNARGSGKAGGLLSPENLLGCVIGFLSLMYLFGSRDPEPLGFGPAGGPDLLWVLLLLGQAAVCCLLVYPDEKKNPLLWTAAGTLAVCFLVRLGDHNRLFLLAGVPSFSVLFLLAAKSLRTARQGQGNRLRFPALLCALAVSAGLTVYGIARPGSSSAGETGDTEADRFFRLPAYSAAAGDNALLDYFMEIQAPWHYDEIDAGGGVVGEITGSWTLEQCFRMPSTVTVSKVSVFFATYARTNECTVELVLKDEEGNRKTLASIDCSTLADNALYTAEIEPVTLRKNKLYALEFTTPDACHGNAVTVYRSAGEGWDWQYAAFNGEMKDFDLAVGFGK